MKKKEDTNKKKISEILNEVNESMAGEEKVYDTAGDKTLYNENEAEGVDEAEQALKTDVSKTDVSKIDVSSTDVTDADVSDAEITEEENNAPKPFHGNTQIILSLRVIVAGYLLYTSYSLVTDYMKGNSMPLWGLLLSVITFSVFAIVVGGLALKALIKGEYVGGKADTSSNNK
ncbi:MAG: hypothetical protein SOW12_04560 [Lachnospiraceae bacterium]|nr:hypothetical protein [Lachnoclostridium sp.]MDD7521814.1 hypothetical protein [Lachnoclostridium sp.]MDY2599188.1 hypothetical protein [Lachnospiraceae bacterium]